MSDPKPRVPKPRKHPVPIPDWWTDAAREAARARGLIQAQLADRVWKMLGGDRPPSQSAVSRCLDGKITTIELVDAISSVLGLPTPVAIASSRLEALALAQERLRFRQDIEAAKLESSLGVKSNQPSSATIPGDRLATRKSTRGGI